MLQIHMPQWLQTWQQAHSQPPNTIEHPDSYFMRLTLELARLNFSQTTVDQCGGPFAALIVNKHGILAAAGNQVVASQCSTAHAEILALSFAQQKLARYSLKDPSNPCTLYTSAQMCAMCCGAVVWSGVQRIVFGASAMDTERLTGFDEGPIHPEWRDELIKRGIDLEGPFMQIEACAVLEEYAQAQQPIYNP